MPNLILPDEGIADQLTYILSVYIPGVLPWQLRLFVNDLVPDANTVTESMVEATFSGYSRYDLERAQWTVPTVADGCASSTWGTEPITWYVTGPTSETVYGYGLVDSTSGVLRAIQRFEDADIAPLVVGGRFLLLPEYTLTSAACGG